MNIKEFINAHFYPLGDTEANWEKVKNFIPPKKEFIIYEPDENYSYNRLKIGDGVTDLHELPFVADIDKIKEDYIDPLEDKITTIQNEIVQPQINVTWEELKQLRDNAQLIPGQFYRITDYYCTTAQENTRAVNNQFDIIVQALSASELSENASADYHDEDTYFQTASSVSIIDSNIISEQVETIFVDGDVEWIYCIYEDFGGESYGIKDGAPHDDVFVAFDFLANNNGVTVPVLFKNEVSLDEETGEPKYGLDDIDYHDAFFYIGEEVIDGEVYDKWRKIEGDGSDSGESSEVFTWDSTSKQYALTNKIVGEGLLIEATFTYGEGPIKKLANLPAWELKYCLDNDTSRFAWAGEKGFIQQIINLNSRYSDGQPLTRLCDLDGHNPHSQASGYQYAWGVLADIDGTGGHGNVIYSEEEILIDNDMVWNAWDEKFQVANLARGNIGHGVIYYMKDEYNNEAPYDFKNIQFLRTLDEEGNFDQENGEDTWCYTFTAYDKDNNKYFDASVITGRNTLSDCMQYCVNNRINEYRSELQLMLNDIVFLNSLSIAEESYFSCYSNTFGDNCYSNTFGNNCQSNTFGNNCLHNTFGNNCCSNTFGSDCYSNTFGSCNFNTFGNYCCRNTFGNYCYRNTFGNNCHNNTFRNSCQSNTFGNDCDYNTFGNNCSYNTFGNNCSYNTFVHADVNEEPEDYFRYINFADECTHIKLLTDEKGNWNYWIQYVIISFGVKGTSRNPRKISIIRNSADDIRPVVYEANNTKHIILD